MEFFLRMNHDQIALELLVRNGYVKAAEKLAASSSLSDSMDKLTEARIYEHIHDMWSSKTTNANFGVLPERAKLFYDQPGFREYFNRMTNSGLIRDFLALVYHAVTVSDSTMGGSDSLKSMSLLDNASMHSALSRTHQEHGNGTLVYELADLIERVNFHGEKLRKIPLAQMLRTVVKKGKQFEKNDRPILQDYEGLPCLPEGRLSYWVGEFERVHGYLSDQIFQLTYNAIEQEYLAHKIVHWFGSDDRYRTSTFFHFECRYWNQDSRPYNKKTIALKMGKAIEKELDHGSLKRVAFLLEFPDHIIDRANPFLEGFVKAYDLATSSGERRAPLNQASFMYVCG